MTSAHACLHNICVFIMFKVCYFTVELIHLNFEIFGVKNAIKFLLYNFDPRNQKMLIKDYARNFDRILQRFLHGIRHRVLYMN